MRVICPHCQKVNNVPKKDSYKKAICGSCKTSLLSYEPLELYNANFDEIIVNSDIPVIVDFWAPWCGPCRSFAPTFKNTAQQFPLKALFAKVNTQEEQNLGARFGIRSIPTLIIFKKGKEIDRVSGALDATNLSRLVQRYV